MALSEGEVSDMNNFIAAIISSVVVSLIAFVGIIALALNDKLLNKIQILLVGLGAGGLIGGAFLHMIPESINKFSDYTVLFLFVLSGFIFFFILEKFLFWRHCHDGKCTIHTFTYLNLVGDGIHNFIDGLIIGGSFIVDIKFGMVVTFAIILHEIPQELGDFGVLTYGGMKKSKALFFNFLSALTAIIGTVAGYFFSQSYGAFMNVLFPFAAGGFIYIASCDLIPELHKQTNKAISILSIISFLIGITFMLLVKFINVG